MQITRHNRITLLYSEDMNSKVKKSSENVPRNDYTQEPFWYAHTQRLLLEISFYSNVTLILELDKSPTRRLSQPHDDCTPPRTRTMPRHGRCSSLPVSPSASSVSATTLTTPPTESYIQAKRNIINLNQEYRRQMLYGSNPLVWRRIYFLPVRK